MLIVIPQALDTYPVPALKVAKHGPDGLVKMVLLTCLTRCNFEQRENVIGRLGSFSDLLLPPPLPHPTFPSL